MALHLELIKILKNEIVNDPFKMGYMRYINQPAQIARMLNEARGDTAFESQEILDALEYLNWLEQEQIVQNVHLVKDLVVQIAMTGGDGLSALSGVIANNGAGMLLGALEYYGIDLFLNSFGLTNYVGDKDALHTTLINVLTHAATIGAVEISAKKIDNALPPRIVELFNGIPGAPNAVTEKDIQEAKTYGNL